MTFNSDFTGILLHLKFSKFLLILNVFSFVISFADCY